MLNLAILLLVVLFVLQSMALIGLIIAKGRWLSAPNVLQLGLRGLLREVHRQMTGWFFLLVASMFATTIAVIVCVAVRNFQGWSR